MKILVVDDERSTLLLVNELYRSMNTRPLSTSLPGRLFDRND